MTREEKILAEMRLQELERDHMQRQEQLRLESEQRALVRLVWAGLSQSRSGPLFTKLHMEILT